MSVTELMQSRVAVDDVAIDPGIFAFRARLDYCRKCFVDGNFKRLPAHETTQCMWHMKIVQGQDGARVGRKPLNRFVVHGHRKNTEPVTLKQEFGIDHGRSVKPSNAKPSFRAKSRNPVALLCGNVAGSFDSAALRSG